jgi:hypothetical protein
VKKLALSFLLFPVMASAQVPVVPDTIKVGTYVISVHDINFHDKEYTMRFWIWFLYDNPDLDLPHEIDITNAKSMEVQQVLKYPMGGKYWLMMKMKCVMKQNWQVKDFPFDRQHLELHLEHSIYSRNSLVFAPDTAGSTFDKDYTLDGWAISNFKVDHHTNDYFTAFGDPALQRQYSEYDSFDLSMDIGRDAVGLFLKIFIGMYIAFFIATIGFAPHPQELEPRFGLPVGGLFAAVGNKYIIDSILPESSSFSLVDTLHTLTFVGIFATVAVSAIALRFVDNGQREHAERINRLGARWVVISYVVLNAIFIFLAVI